MYYIGVDLGTSAVKLLLMEESGKICNIVSKEYPLFFPHPGWSEQNPEDWFTQSVEGMKELTEGIDRSLVAGIGFGGQMHGLVTLDENDQVIRPAILWNDGRSQKETEYLNNEIGKDKLSAYTANIAFAGFTAPKILWMKKNEPDKFAKIAKIMLPKDYLAYRLSGSFCTDVSDASGMLLLDVKNRCWSKEMMEICDVKEEQLPKLYESWEVVGTLKPEVAEELGFSADEATTEETEQNADTDPVNEEFLQITEKRAFQEGESVLIEIVSANTAYNRLYIGNRSDEDKTPVIEGSMDEEGRYHYLFYIDPQYLGEKAGYVPGNTADNSWYTEEDLYFMLPSEAEPAQETVDDNNSENMQEPQETEENIPADNSGEGTISRAVQMRCQIRSGRSDHWKEILQKKHRIRTKILIA